MGARNLLNFRPSNATKDQKSTIKDKINYIISILILLVQAKLVICGTGKWTVGLTKGISTAADHVAYQSGCVNLGLVRGFDDVFLFERNLVKRQHDDDDDSDDLFIDHRTKRTLESHPMVVWVDPQKPQIRVKRDLFTRLSNMGQMTSLMAAPQSAAKPAQPAQPHSQIVNQLTVISNQQQFSPVQQQQQSLQQPIGPAALPPNVAASALPNHQLQLLPASNIQQQQQQQQQQQPRPSIEPDNFNDDLWRLQWYLKDSANVAIYQNDIELKVEDVWRMGYTGKGVVVTILDDGLEWNHTDIFPNYDPRASWDMNNNRSDPFPRYDHFDENSHGTRCAGEVAMVANNRKCGVGVAPRARIGGIKCLDGVVEDNIESSSLLHNMDYIDIYSGSWGPSDNGQVVDGPKRLATQALEKGARFGRKGKGVLYVWANGNGGARGDNCNCDGYVTSIYTISIGGVSQQGQSPPYGERCSSTLAVTCSSGAYNDRKVVTTDLHNKCTVDYSGTSAAAPLAAGVFALVLEANPNITWRDAQHLTAWTSNPIPLRDNPGWKRNAAGLIFNSRFGFGLLNAKAMVDAALQWKIVPKKSICIVSSATRLPLFLRSKDAVRASFITDGCQREFELSQQQKQLHQQQQHPYYKPLGASNRLGGGAAVIPGSPPIATSFSMSYDMQQHQHQQQQQQQQQQQVNPVIYLEHVELKIDIDYSSRGFLEIFLISPSGTVSTLLTRRPFDESRSGFEKWSLMSVHYWAETSMGEWKLIVRDKEGQNQRGLLRNATLILHGTQIRPAHMNQPRQYDADETVIKNFLSPIAELEEADLFDLNDFPNDMALVNDYNYQPTFVKSIVAMEQMNRLSHSGDAATKIA